MVCEGLLGIFPACWWLKVVVQVKAWSDPDVSHRLLIDGLWRVEECSLASTRVSRVTMRLISRVRGSCLDLYKSTSLLSEG